MTTSVITDKVRENRLRRMADRQGLRLMKSRARDPRSLTFDCYTLIDARTGFLVNVDDPLRRGYPFDNLDQVEDLANRIRPMSSTTDEAIHNRVDEIHQRFEEIRAQLWLGANDVIAGRITVKAAKALNRDLGREQTALGRELLGLGGEIKRRHEAVGKKMS